MRADSPSGVDAPDVYQRSPGRQTGGVISGYAPRDGNRDYAAASPPPRRRAAPGRRTPQPRTIARDDACVRRDGRMGGTSARAARPNGIRGSAAQWPGEDPRRPQASSSYRYLLDLDDDLAEEFDLRMRVVARQVVTVVVMRRPRGRTRARPTGSQPPAAGPACWSSTACSRSTRRSATGSPTELVGAGDLLQPWEPAPTTCSSARASWRALVPSRLALLDAAFAERVRPWPQIAHVLLRRAGRRAGDLNVQRAITSQPRLEVRLALLLGTCAARWGKVEPGGIRLPLPLTHQLLGRLVGAERPSVSHALARLSARGPRHRPRRRVAPARDARPSHLAALAEPARRARRHRRGASRGGRARDAADRVHPAPGARPSGSSSTCSG